LKKILITGGTGFIGSHLAEKCIQKGYQVTVFDRYNVNYNLGNLSNSIFRKKIKFVFGDIRDFDSVDNVVKKNDIILHLAALIGIPYSYISPNAYIKTNIEGTYNILESAKKNKCSKVFVTSTSEVYGSAKYMPIDENHPLQPQSPYSASKIAADNLALSYYYSFNLPVAIIRPFNTYGPRQSQRAVIPTIINQILNTKDNFIELGNLTPTRDFSYVTDICEGFIKAINSKNLSGEVINLGTGNNFSIKKIAQLISKLIKREIKFKKSNLRFRPKKSEVQNLCSSIKKAKKKLNWKPKYTGVKGFERGLLETIEWNKKLKKNNFSNKKYIF
jgi:NAD dependent epimerase/dehydratase